MSRMTSSAPAKVMGTDSPATTASRQAMVSSRMAKTMAMVCNALTKTSVSESQICVASFCVMVYSSPLSQAPSLAMSSSVARMEATKLTVSAPGILRTDSSNEGSNSTPRSLKKAREVSVSCMRCTDATSSSRTARPAPLPASRATGSARRSSTSRKRPSRRTTAPMLSLRISPKGCSMLACCTALRMAEGDNPSASRRSGRNRIWTISSRSPPMSTSLTPGRRSSVSRKRRACSFIAAELPTPCRVKVKMGRSSTDACLIVGRSTSVGSSASASATAARNRVMASTGSAEASNSTEMTENESNEALSTRRTPCRVVTSSSMMSVTCSSMVCGSAPGHSVVMVAWGMFRSGSDSLTSCV